MENRQIALNVPGLSDREDLVAFRLGEQMYALPSAPIVKIIEMVTITPIPQVNHVVEGVINMRGRAVPVIYLRRLFGLPEIPFQLRTPIIIVQIKEQNMGLIVDEVIDILSLSEQQISRVADIMPEGMGEAPVLRGLAHIQNEAVLLLDLNHLLDPRHVQQLAQVMSVLPDSVAEESPEGEGDPVLEEDVEAEVEAGEQEEDESGGGVDEDGMDEPSTEVVVEEVMEEDKA